MKQAISVFFALVILTVGAYAQVPGQRRGGDNGWRERVRSEKVAFLTEEIDLTESEAQVFWPIYNQIQKEQRDNFEAVRKAYDAGTPKSPLRHQLRVLLYTILLIATLFLTIAVSAVGRHALEFIANYIYLSNAVITLWSRLRFVGLGAVLFVMIALLYALALDERHMTRGIWPGVLASLAAWIGLSMLFSLYVEHAANYSVIYGSIGAIIVLLLWLYLSASMLIMGAEFNSVLLDIGCKQ